ncbi:MAG: trigger factor [Patescibacteria group bacterium]|jgi:trigger factor
MNVQIEHLHKNQIKLTIELQSDEIKSALEKTAQHISEHANFAGFRPGKAPYNMVVQKYGEAAIYQEAAEEIVRQTYPQAVIDNKLEAIGRPEVALVKVAPGNPFVYTATVALMPEVTLGDYKNIKARKKDIKLDEKELERTLEDLRWMRSKEALVDRPARKGDRIEVDLHLSLDGVALENGQAHNQSIILGKQQVVPGMEEQLTGMKKGDVKEFKLSYPKDYFQKQLAGKEVNFKATAKNIYQIDLPEVNDEFAKAVGKFENRAALEKQINANLHHEHTEKEQQRFEVELIKEIVASTKFGEIPDVLVESELDRMLSELKQGAVQQGLSWENYLQQLKKTEADLRQEFVEQAHHRIKSALVLRAIQQQEQLTVSPDQIDAEIKHQKEHYKDDVETYGKIDSPQYRDYLENVMLNRKVFEFLEGLVYPIAAK